MSEYNRKRDFNKTKEPKYRVANKNGFCFVIQHHLARKDHYDFRLEVGGVLKSWAIPKGPSFNPSDKRLAIEVEDHPLDYRHFEGIIPKGEYGGGTVMIWDEGIWEALEVKEKSFKFILHGQRLKGKWTLVKFKDNNWLLIKEKDEYAYPVDISAYNTSIKTGRTMEEIEKNYM